MADFIIENGTLTKYNGNGGDVVIPSGVTEIGGSAFLGCTTLQSIMIPDSVTAIGEYAFRVCTSLQSITIGNGVTSIGNWAFKGCTTLQSIMIPDSVKRIGKRAFSDCKNLQSITLPDSVKEIGSGAFSRCTSLQSITIPDGVTKIGWRTFSGCTSLQCVTIPESVTNIDDWAFNACTNLQSLTLGDNITDIICSGMFLDCRNIKEIHYTGKEPILFYFKCSDALCHWALENPSNFHPDDIMYCFEKIARNISYSGMIALENHGFITKENAQKLLELLRASGNVECTGEMIRYLNEKQILGNYMDQFTLDLDL